jgi:sirohydrochlorin ferrochelatase
VLDRRGCDALAPANQAVRAVAADLASAGNFPHVEAVFLELGQPPFDGRGEKEKEKSKAREKY